jgi:hypothetical protein
MVFNTVQDPALIQAQIVLVKNFSKGNATNFHVQKMASGMIGQTGLIVQFVIMR